MLTKMSTNTKQNHHDRAKKLFYNLLYDLTYNLYLFKKSLNYF